MINGVSASGGGTATPTTSRLWTITERIDMPSQRKMLPPIHPGQILREDLRDMGVSLNQLSRDLRVPMNRISAIVNGKRSITADTAIRLARYFGTSAQYWMNLQTGYDLQVAERSLAGRIDRDVLPRSAA
jgi:addiction module HigA family antidote